MIKILLFVGVMVVLIGCSPRYSTNYTYVRPATEQGQLCASQCDAARLQCLQNEQLKKQNCETEKRLKRAEYDLCVEKNGAKKCTYPMAVFCGADKKSCLQSYNICYANCGGVVTGERVCVSNCDQ
jgi:hypothetical protein